MRVEPMPLLSRVADSVYWMARYIERAENVARFIGVNLNLQIDLPLAPAHQWQPLIDTTGDAEEFKERFGVATIKDGKVVKIVEKPKEPETNLAVIGIYMFDPSVFDICRTLKPSNRGELEITDVNNEYVRRGNLTYEH